MLHTAQACIFSEGQPPAIFYSNVNLYLLQGSHLEQVVKVSRSSKPKVNGTDDAVHTDVGPTSTVDEEHMQPDEDYSGTEETNVEQDVDRLIDADNNEYVLSRAKGGVALTLDPLLIQVTHKHWNNAILDTYFNDEQLMACMQDLTVVLTTSSVFGTLFEAIKQPTLNGYILAGSLVGPDGLALVKELVQVESLAQVTVPICDAVGLARFQARVCNTLAHSLRVSSRFIYQELSACNTAAHFVII